MYGGPHDETAVVSMIFESGATAEFCSSVQFESPPAMEVYGSRGYAIGVRTLGPHGAGSIATRDGKLRFEIENPYVGEIVDFAQAVRDGRPPAVGAREGLRNVELLTEIA